MFSKATYSKSVSTTLPNNDEYLARFKACLPFVNQDVECFENARGISEFRQNRVTMTELEQNTTSTKDTRFAYVDSKASNQGKIVSKLEYVENGIRFIDID